MKILVQFSGGKDSTASLILAHKKYGQKVVAVFCDTGWEHDLTYKYIEETTNKLGVQLVVLKSKKYESFLDLAKKKKRFPSSKARFCTEELKSKPFIDYVLQHNEHLIIFQGVRRAESKSRSKMKSGCRFFKYYFEPYGLTKKGKPKYHSYRKKEVLEWSRKYSESLIRNVFDWSGQEVIDFILKSGLEPNPLYSMDMKRVGCMPCIMARLGEIKQISNRFPEVIETIGDFEKEHGHSFFTNGKIPDRYCSKFHKKPFPTIEDVTQYTKGNPDQVFLIEDNVTSCMSYYGICE